MSARRHTEVRAPADEPCPFCGCGLPLSQHARRPTRRRARGPLAPPLPLEELPEWWRPFARSHFVPSRQISTTEAATLAALDRIKGQTVTIDERRNAIRAA